jgi:hypothetical protein
VNRFQDICFTLAILPDEQVDSLGKFYLLSGEVTVSAYLEVLD